MVDVSDGEKTVGINTPGQSGNPDDPHYRDLFTMWAEDWYLPVPFARPRVEAAMELRRVLLAEEVHPR